MPSPSPSWWRSPRPDARAGWASLEREHVLAGVPLAPTLTILALFIAYPFVLGI